MTGDGDAPMRFDVLAALVEHDPDASERAAAWAWRNGSLFGVADIACSIRPRRRSRTWPPRGRCFPGGQVVPVLPLNVKDQNPRPAKAGVANSPPPAIRPDPRGAPRRELPAGHRAV